MIAGVGDLRTSYGIRHVHVMQQHQEQKYPPETLPDGDPALVFGWDWKVEDETELYFEVAITVGFEASRLRPEEARVVVVGSFSMQHEAESPALGFDKFVEQNAPAILFPYARAAIATLTSQSPLGTYTLPPIDVIALMGAETAAATTGARQLQGNPDLARRFGWPVEPG